MNLFDKIFGRKKNKPLDPRTPCLCSFIKVGITGISCVHHPMEGK